MPADALSPPQADEPAIAGSEIPPSQEVVDFALRQIEIGEKEYETNLPEGVNIFGADAADIEQDDLVVEELDKLDEGTFWVTREDEEPDFGGTTIVTRKREITILESDEGKVVDRDSMGGMWEHPGGVEDLMSDLGYVFVEDDAGNKMLAGIPTPETVKEAALKLGVEIEYCDGDPYIDGNVYLGAYRDGKYPASYGHYKHDIEDDHITALVLGGEQLKDALAGAAGRALDNGDEQVIKDAARDIDAFTATLRSVVAPGILLGEAYGETKGRATLVRIGAGIGIDQENVDQILKTAQESAEEYGMDVQALS